MSPHQPPHSHHPSQNTQKQESFPHPLLGPVAPSSSLACFSPPASELALPSLGHHWVPPQLLCPAGPPAYRLLSVWGTSQPSLGGGGSSKICLQESTVSSPAPAPSSGAPPLCEGIFMDTVFLPPGPSFLVLENSKAPFPLLPAEVTWIQSLRARPARKAALKLLVHLLLQPGLGHRPPASQLQVLLSRYTIVPKEEGPDARGFFSFFSD